MAGHETERCRQGDPGKLKYWAGSGNKQQGDQATQAESRNSGSEIQAEGETARDGRRNFTPRRARSGDRWTAAGLTDLPLPFPASPGLPISQANYPLLQQQPSSLIPLWPLLPSPSLSLPQSLLQSSSLFKMSFRSCSPDSCSILEPMLGPGGWVLEGHPPGQQSGWRRVGGVQACRELRHPHTLHPRLPLKHGPHPQHHQGVQTLPTCPSRAFKG